MRLTIYIDDLLMSMKCNILCNGIVYILAITIEGGIFLCNGIVYM